MPDRPPKLLEQVRAAMQARHMSPRTVQAYVGWIRRYAKFHGLQHPRQLGDAEVIAFLTALVAKHRVARSTQIQAFSALQFLYRDVLRQPLGDIRSVIRSTTPARLPAVLNCDEVRRLLDALDGDAKLVALLLSGAALPLMECLTLRAKRSA